eukprot:3935010-Rhodomonas_salina.2
MALRRKHEGDVGVCGQAADLRLGLPLRRRSRSSSHLPTPPQSRLDSNSDSSHRAPVLPCLPCTGNMLPTRDAARLQLASVTASHLLHTTATSRSHAHTACRVTPELLWAEVVGASRMELMWAELAWAERLELVWAGSASVRQKNTVRMQRSGCWATFKDHKGATGSRVVHDSTALTLQSCLSPK